MKQLKKYLLLNSGFSAFTGLVMLLASGRVAILFNSKSTLIFKILGTNLLIFSCFVAWVAVLRLTNQFVVRWIIALDIGWVIGSLLIILFQLFDLSDIGYVLLLLVAVWIGFLAYKQKQYLP